MQGQVKNSIQEGEHKLQYITYVKLNYNRVLIVLIFCLITGMLGALYFKWFPKHFNKIIYVQCSLMEATHIMTTPFQEICSINKNELEISFRFRFVKYKLIENLFQVQEYQSQKNYPLTEQNVLILRKEYGNSQMIIPIIGFFQFLIEELTAPFYVLQYICDVVWIIQGFFSFALAMLGFSLLATFISYIFLRQSLLRLQSLAFTKQMITVIREQGDQLIDSNEIVPGDIIKLNPMILPGDCILTGKALVNEATLTGESQAIPKQSGQWLYEGTKLLESFQGATAIIYRTNFSTVRGQFFKNVLFPKKEKNIFQQQAVKFSLLYLIFNIIILASTSIIYENYSTELIVAYVLNVITNVFPNAMPIFIALTQIVGLLRLKYQGILGSNMNKIQEAGKLNMLCFDKTGTLTTNELIVNELYSEKDCQMCLSCCHNISIYENQLVGDIIDLEMFKFSQGEILFQQENEIVNCKGKQYKIIKIFEFNQSTMMMSVIVQYQNEYFLCSKGAPDKIIQITKGLKQQDNEQLNEFVNQGYRVISLCKKQLAQQEIDLPREQLEQNLTFLGFLIFENKLKYETVEVIQELLESKLSIKILSGDNPLTTINTAFTISILEQNVKLFDIINNQIQETDLEFLNDKQIIVKQSQFNIDFDEFQNYIQNIEQSCAVTGNFLEFVEQKKIDIKNLYQQIVVFARVKPNQKKEIIEFYQKLNNCVAMTGDGSNDCSAISQSNVGVSFSQADASYIAHFSISNQSIKCLVNIIRQGRASVQNISEIFFLFLLCNFIQFISFICQAIDEQNYSDFQQLYISFFCQIPLMAALTLSKPLIQLSDQIPSDNMFSLNNQTSFYGHAIIFSLGLVISNIIIVNSKDHQITYHNSQITDYYRNGLLNSISNIYSLIASIALSVIIYISKPFKEKFFKNIIFTLIVIIHLILTLLYLFLEQTSSVLDLINFNSQINHFDGYFLLIMTCTIIVDIIYQEILWKCLPRSKQLM